MTVPVATKIQVEYSSSSSILGVFWQYELDCNQSQTQLKELYDVINGGGRRKGKNKGKKGRDREEREMAENCRAALKNRNEFIAYRIIYYVFLSGNRKYEGDSSDIFKVCVCMLCVHVESAFITVPFA